MNQLQNYQFALSCNNWAIARQPGYVLFFETAILERCRHRSIRNGSTKIHGTGRWDHLRKTKLMILLHVVSRWWQLKYFFCSPRSLGNIFNLTNDFQMDWFNHRPVQTWIELQSEFFVIAFGGTITGHIPPIPRIFLHIKPLTWEVKNITWLVLWLILHRWLLPHPLFTSGRDSLSPYNPSKHRISLYSNLVTNPRYSIYGIFAYLPTFE